PTASWSDFTSTTGAFRGGWIVGGYLSDWTGGDVPAAFRGAFTVVQDILPNEIVRNADVVLPAAAWAEKDGCWENWQNRIQPFEAAIDAPAGIEREGALYARLLGRADGYDVTSIRREMGGDFADVAFARSEDEAESPFEFADL